MWNIILSNSHNFPDFFSAERPENCYFTIFMNFRKKSINIDTCHMCLLTIYGIPIHVIKAETMPYKISFGAKLLIAVDLVIIMVCLDRLSVCAHPPTDRRKEPDAIWNGERRYFFFGVWKVREQKRRVSKRYAFYRHVIGMM